MKLPRDLWIFKGSSNLCQDLEYDPETDRIRKSKPCGFYDIVSTEDTVEGGVHVRVVRPGEITLTREELRSAFINSCGVFDVNGYYDAVDYDALECELFGEVKE